MNKEEFNDLSKTIKSYVHQASQCAPRLKQSSMEAVCYLHKEPLEIVESLDALKDTDNALMDGPLNFRKRLYATLGDNYTGRKVSKLLENELSWEFGRTGCKVTEFTNRPAVCEALSGYRGGPAPFYIVEDLFFAEFDEVTVLFYIGSDE